MAARRASTPSSDEGAPDQANDNEHLVKLLMENARREKAAKPAAVAASAPLPKTSFREMATFACLLPLYWASSWAFGRKALGDDEI